MGNFFSDAWDKVKDVFGGEEVTTEPGFTPLPPEIRDAQESGRIFQLAGAADAAKVYRSDPSQVAGRQLIGEAGAIQNATQSSMQRLRDLTQRRGLGNSSLGLSQEIGLKRQASKDIGTLRASLPDRIRALREQQGIGQMNIGSNILGTPGIVPQFNKGTQGYEGGILPMVGAAAGAYFGKGDPGAIQAGYGAGQGVQSGFNTFR